MAVRSHYAVPCDAAAGCLVYVSKGRVWLETPPSQACHKEIRE